MTPTIEQLGWPVAERRAVVSVRKECGKLCSVHSMYKMDSQVVYVVTCRW